MPSTSLMIFIINWNSANLTDKCLASLAREVSSTNNADCRILVIDNGSDDDDVSLLMSAIAKHDEALDVTSLMLPKNMGYAGAINAAMRLSSGVECDYYWLLNNDTELCPESLSSLISFLSQNPHADVIGPTVVDAETAAVQCAGGCFYNRWTGTSKHYLEGRAVYSLKQLQPEKHFSYIFGAAVVIAGPLLRSLGGLDDSYFLFFEELELARRIDPSKMAWSKSTLIRHQGSQSKKRSAQQRCFAIEQSTLSCLKHTARHYPLCLPSVMICRVGGGFARGILLFEPDQALAPIRAALTFLKVQLGGVDL